MHHISLKKNDFCANLSLMYSEVDLIDRLRLAALDGFKAVEIQFPYELSSKVLRDRLHQYDLECILINIPAGDLMQGGEGLAAVPNKHDDLKLAVEQTLEYIDILNIPKINILAGRCLVPTKRDEYLQQFMANLEYIGAQFKGHSSRLMIEAINDYDMNGFLLTSPEDVITCITGSGQNQMMLQYDIYHMHRMERDIWLDVEQYINKIGHIQFANCPGRHEPGVGELDIMTYLRHLRTLGYDGHFGAEYKPSQITSKTLDWFYHLENSEKHKK